MRKEMKSVEEIKILLSENKNEHTRKFLQLAKVSGWTVYLCQGSMDGIRWLNNNAVPDLIIIVQNASTLEWFQQTVYLTTAL